ncbi:MAG: undecaprenyl-diphosphate phosphatase [Sphingomonas sp.]|uniref:undecaprenyl-diphosphate phosphatase n=1 Tax=Sphingomonas sp. TaxID=28214 RepID=UPI001855BD59|nr:undecaprenyl-diphosphate phosphatase [Sphingomonas sp.]MBA3666659.1 undecaprenyl-diphosphate phosphatase [Sphingomonas sp.]
MPILLLIVILGIVEGLTEYLPVSSTGHLILATELLGFDAERWALFNVAIQPGAILAIVVLYWRTFRDVLVGLWRRDRTAWTFTRNLLIAFFPAVVLGVALGDQIDALLENATVVAWALIVGGIAIILIERVGHPKPSPKVERPDQMVAAVSLKQSILIGLAQCLAMVPGVSRSGATIMGAVALGIDRKTAADFSFFLAVPTLAGATALQLAKHYDQLEAGMTGHILIGAAVSFVVAIVVVKAFVAFIQRHGFTPFGWYRIIAGAAALVWLAMR